MEDINQQCNGINRKLCNKRINNNVAKAVFLTYNNYINK